VLRAVLDANVFVSAYVRPEGPPGRILDRFFREPCFEIVLTPAIVDEVLRALRYPKVRKAARTVVEPDLWFEDVVVLAELVTGGLVLPPLGSDPDNEKYVPAVVEGRASFVVTGDPDLLSLSAHQGVRIVTPRAFLELL
jgi:putative PIN family toxin of toxin-antitoxin system